MKKAIIFIVGITIFISCSKKDGIWDDNIILSAKKATFSAESDSITITTEGGWWWITDVKFQEKIYLAIYTEDDFTGDFITFSDDDFLVKKINKHTLFIKVNKNNSGYQRFLYVNLEAGDYFDSVKITQLAK